jgi:nicotinamidase-related amidase
MTKTALILIDIQNDYFPDFPQCRMPLPHMAKAAGNAAKLLEKARKQGAEVIHIQHIAASDAAPFFRPGSKGAEIHQRVCPEKSERIVQKARPNGFVQTDLHAILQKQGITNLTICGAMSQMCIDATARAAVDLGYKVTIAEDACAASDIAFGGENVPAKLVHAAIMAPLGASYAKVIASNSSDFNANA